VFRLVTQPPQRLSMDTLTVPRVLETAHAHVRVLRHDGGRRFA